MPRLRIDKTILKILEVRGLTLTLRLFIKLHGVAVGYWHNNT